MVIKLTPEKIRREFPNNRVKDKTFEDRLEIEGAEGFEIIDCTFTYKDRGDVLELLDCKKCKLIGCTFEGKNKKGNFIHIKGKNSFDNRIEKCTFKNFKRLSENGGEAIIIGHAKFTGCRFKTHIIDCTFDDCNGEKEMISIKSCENVIEGNTFKNWKFGSVSIRNGGFNKILDNRFIGRGGGIIVRGDGNQIIGNIHENNNNSDLDLRPLVIENGNKPFDEGFVRDGEPQPLGEQGAKFSGYAQAKNNTIERNTYVDCKGICVLWGDERRSKNPVNNTFRNNTLKAVNENSVFLRFNSRWSNATKEEVRRTNTFGNNRMEGDKAKRGDLP